jgi:hypothetical protein
MAHKLVVNVRTEGCDVYVGRPSKWGNPIHLHRESERAEVLERYREYLKSHPEIADAARKELRGKVLGCWCAPKACHADVLAEIANA